jgi:two-component system nitrate/nitrite response regulator NarL
MVVVPAACEDARVQTRVLIVDDHASFRSMARAVLTEGGLQVVGEAADAASALAAARDLRPDCVLVDVQLGDDDGFVLTEILVGHGARAVVLTSGRDPRDFESLISASAARGFIAKERLSAAALGALLQ